MKHIFTLLLILSAYFIFAQAGAPPAGRIGYRYYIQYKHLDTTTAVHYIKKTNYQLLLGNPTYPATAQRMKICRCCGNKRKLIQCDISVTNGVATVTVDGFGENEICAVAEGTHKAIIGVRNNLAGGDQFFFDFHRDSVTPFPAQKRVLFAGMNYGLITLPLKIRRASSYTDTNAITHKVPVTGVASFNLGLFFGATVGQGYVSYKAVRNYSFSLGTFVGPSVATIGPGTISNTTDFAAKTSNSSTVNLPALSYGLCAMGTINTFGLVLAGGWDLPIGPGQNDWIYKNKFWAGIGFVANLPM